MEKRNLGRMSDKSENRFILFELERLNQLISTINAKGIRSLNSDRDDGLLAFHQVDVGQFLSANCFEAYSTAC